MNNILKKVKEDLRIIMSILLLVFMALTWFSSTTKASVESEYVDASTSASISVSGFTSISHSFLSVILFVVPIVFIALFFVPALGKFKKAVYPIGSLTGIVLVLLCGFAIKGALAAGADAAESMGAMGGAEVESSSSFGVGFWLTLIDYAAILVYSLIVDFKISKASFKEQGLKGLVTSVASDVANSAASMAQDVKSGDMMRDIQAAAKGEGAATVTAAQPAEGGNPCPQCGKIILTGKKFCKGCGYKIPQDAAAPSTVASSNTTADAANNESSGIATKLMAAATAGRANKAVTAKGNVNGIVCEVCGLVSDYTKEYCADCGTKLKNVKICANCGANIIEGKAFCADCGTSVSVRNLCKKCGAEIWGRKTYCACCGEKVNYMKTCSNCGAEVIPEKNFCPDCGTPYKL